MKHIDKYIGTRYIVNTIYRLPIYKETIYMNDIYALTETTYYILLALVKPCHGYGIMQTVENLSGGRIRLAAGTLYGALNALVDKGWITQLPVEAGSRRKQYVITDEGMIVLENELERLKELVSSGETVLKGEI